MEDLVENIPIAGQVMKFLKLAKKTIECTILKIRGGDGLTDIAVVFAT
jgi:hypothetical protein